MEWEDLILESLEKRQNHPSKSQLGIDEINTILIEAYDERPTGRSIIKSIAKSDFEESWGSELAKFKNQPNIDQEQLEAMIQNK